MDAKTAAWMIGLLLTAAPGLGAEGDERFHGGPQDGWGCSAPPIAGPHAGGEACDIVPVAVWSRTPTRPSGQAALDGLIDGDWSTACCFLDDTPTGADAGTVPPHGAAPVTAGFVLDLGTAQTVSGIRFVAQRSWANCMAEEVSVFACDDREGNANVRPLNERCRLPPVNTFNTAFVEWPPVATRFLRVQVNESYDRARNGTDWWRGIDPKLDRQAWRCDERLRCQFGWWWNWWLDTVRKLPGFAGGGPRYDVAGTGRAFTVQIAEVSCFRGRPGDLPLPNGPRTAYPEERLTRDWLYQDCGAENVSLVANSAGGTRPDGIGPDISRCFTSRADSAFEQAMVRRVTDELSRCGADVSALAARARSLSGLSGSDPRWKALYLDACRLRRAERLKALRLTAPQFLYVKHYVFGGWTQIEPTDELTDEQFYERNPDFHEGAQLCLATIREDGSVSNEVLIDKPHGMIRDPNLSFDGKVLIFSMRDNFATDDNHLYAMSLADRKIRQLTCSPTVDGKAYPCSDTEPCFAPNGEIIFQSTRCGQSDVCWVHPASNLYTCDGDGKHIRRLAFDQVRTLYPQVLDDGRVIYTRWEYNDRNPFFEQSLFVMNADGTAQTAFYGNDSVYPAAMIHSRGIPGSGKVVTVISGHHVLQKGKLAILDPSKGTDGNSGIEYIAGASPDGRPGRQPSDIRAPYDRSSYDLFGQVGPQWQYPYALDENRFLAAFLPEGSHFLKGPFAVPFGVYYMTGDGRRELLAFDWGNSCGQAIPVMPTRRPPARPSQVDWRRATGTFYVQNVYAGPAGIPAIPPGTVKRLRVVALEYRAAGISKNIYEGPSGGNHINTPVSVSPGSQDVKHVLGEVDIEPDGSVSFEVPARNAVYFQLLDDKGRCVQTMRSWTLVLPGERVGCVGCHENKLQAGAAAAVKPVALNSPVRKLQPAAGQPPHPLLARLEKEEPLANVDLFLGVNRPCSLDPRAPVDGFSYSQRVQPIWDRHCVACHQGDANAPDPKKRSALRLTGEAVPFPPGKDPGGLRAFTYSYLALTAQGPDAPWVKWVDVLTISDLLPPNACGSVRSRLMDYLEPSHYGVRLSDAEKRTVACWIDLAVPFCGSYAEANTWDRQEWRRGWQMESNTWNQPQKELYDYFQRKRVVFARQEIANIQALLAK